MSAQTTIALDAMGGDKGPAIVLGGAQTALIRHPALKFILVGDEVEIRRALVNMPDLAAASEIVHTDVSIAMDMKPSQALRKGRRVSSMWRALDMVKEQRAQAVVSAGNTGALMAMAKFCLKTVPQIERPAIAAIWPTVHSESIVLDVGANVGADAEQLLDFSLMGAAMARALFHINSPKVGLLNIGVEEVKGVEEIREAHSLMREHKLPFTYHGFVEGNDVGQGVVDVVVCEGFSGNIALKTAEGTARQISEYLRAAMGRTFFARLGAFFAQGAFRALKEKMDPSQLNGGIFLGLNGIVIKSHGGTDAAGFASAVDIAYDMARSNLVSEIAENLQEFHNMSQKEPA